MSTTQCLDHLILFVPADPDTRLPKLPPLFKDNFTLTPGGVHADGVTSNTLILLADGCYIELISFIDDSKVSNHWWGPDADYVGWKDWCLTNSKSPEENYNAVKENHSEPQHGGRKRADGVDVKWAVTFPKGGKGGQHVRGRIPFFCHDTTPRNVRVPLSKENTAHPCGALGVRQITIIVKDEALLEQTRHAYVALLSKDGIEQGKSVTLSVGRVQDEGGLDGGAVIVLRLPKDEQESTAVTKSGYSYGNVVLSTISTSDHSKGTQTRLDEDGTDVRGLWLEYV
ncbi:hypothetical protein EK21DRAFT_83422 [Setomelanomma holmii]|uniref:Glyoxalase-like domain-containing protein n=1 Tax=Setomelanomma holmii TaxID=210430 RepID=A0A9P4LU45_9PLEO|nr:hypothetical protein EK21DRAFT_83422 [Setomelanomma holmii]